MPNIRQLKNPRRWYLLPFVSGLFLMILSVLFWYYPRLLLLLVVAPLFLCGMGLFFFGLDIWRGIPNWRDRVRGVREAYWSDDEDR